MRDGFRSKVLSDPFADLQKSPPMPMKLLSGAPI